jgi:hypothetical protein
MQKEETVTGAFAKQCPHIIHIKIVKARGQNIKLGLEIEVK